MTVNHVSEPDGTQFGKWPLVVALAGVSGLAWAYLLHDSGCQFDAICGILTAPQPHRWLRYDHGALFAMWAIMMAAMMVPSVTPAVILFAKLSARRREVGRRFIPASVFLAGYLLAWAGFSAAATLIQSMLHSAALLSSTMKSVSSGLGAAILIGAGIFQFLPAKNRCLNQCRSPIQFFVTHWREGAIGALSMGLRHGFYCVGCCWILMGVLFVTGVMNIAWIGILAGFVVLEKLAPAWSQVSRIGGAALLAWGAVVALRPVI